MLISGSHVGSMHIDQSNQILYYTDTIRKSINSISLMDITQVKTILTDALIPEAFTIDLNSGYVYDYNNWNSSTSTTTTSSSSSCCCCCHGGSGCSSSSYSNDDNTMMIEAAAAAR